MRNRQQDFMFDYLIKGLDQSAQATLRMMYNRSCNLNEIIRRKEIEEMKHEIAEYVISHISATVDVSDVIKQIDELRRAINSLGK